MEYEYHGKSYTRLYRIWQNMKRRCFDPDCPSYRYYGARGITVCKTWSNSFKAFEKWALSHGYEDTLTIDRIDNNKNYTPKNCQWLTRSENSKKKKEDNKKPRKIAPPPEEKTPEQIKFEQRREKMFRKIYGDDWKYYADMNDCRLSSTEKRRIQRKHDRQEKKEVRDFSLTSSLLLTLLPGAAVQFWDSLPFSTTISTPKFLTF